MAPVDLDPKLISEVQGLLNEYQTLHNTLQASLTAWTTDQNHPPVKIAEALKAFEGVITLVALYKFKANNSTEYSNWTTKYQASFPGINLQGDRLAVLASIAAKTSIDFSAIEAVLAGSIALLEKDIQASRGNVGLFGEKSHILESDDTKLLELEKGLREKVKSFDTAIAGFKSQLAENKKNLSSAWNDRKAAVSVMEQILTLGKSKKVADEKINKLKGVKKDLETKIKNNTTDENNVNQQIRDIDALSQKVKATLANYTGDQKSVSAMVLSLQTVKTQFGTLRDHVDPFVKDAKDCQNVRTFSSKMNYGLRVLEAVNRGLPLQSEPNVTTILKEIVAEVEAVDPNDKALINCINQLKQKLGGQNKPLEMLPSNAFPALEDVLNGL